MSYVFDLEKSITTIKRFLAGKLGRSGLDGFVIGLSGGIDSALSATLAVEAVGAEKVLGILMPYRTSSESSVTDARELVAGLGITSREIDISPMIDAYYDKITDDIRLRAGNKMARERMSILFDIAHETGRLVLGTGNRTEAALGYTTWYGDSACSLNPIGELYKTEVRRMARHLHVPEAILTKAPSADLWTSQTDEGEIGVTYETIDIILGKVLDEGIMSMAQLEAAGIDPVDASRIIGMLNRNAFKRYVPDVAPLGRGPIPGDVDLDA
ncbi:MAG: NAD+ synthase [candidate division Zixibacteria bacterium]|nr:NAD+ synthase [candidate division Zixibacteria bacterium]